MYIFFCRSASFLSDRSPTFSSAHPELVEGLRTTYAYAIKLLIWFLANHLKNWPCHTKLYRVLRSFMQRRSVVWGEWWGSNPRHPGPQPGALPTELHPPYQTAFNYTVL
jgi:hypothetical protein